MARKTIWIVSEVYYPEETGTGYVLTRIAEGLAQRNNPVSVLCGQPTYSRRGTFAPKTESRNRVHIQRCVASTLNKDILLFRLINLTTISLSIFFRALFSIQSGDRVMVVTNPPLLPFLVALVCGLRRAKMVLVVHDVYPEIMIATGMIRVNSMLARLGGWLNKILYQSADRIVVLGRDMQQVAARRLLPARQSRIKVIPNWADTDQISPDLRAHNSLLEELGLKDKFIVQYAGNMGRPNDIESILASAERLQENSAIHFIFLGSGSKREWLSQNIAQRNLLNVTLLPGRPRTEQATFLNACDLAIISLIHGMWGLAVPSRTYNTCAAGKPILAIVDQDSEIDLIVREEQIGWVVPPAHPDQIVKAILSAYAHPEQIEEMGRRARCAAEKRFSFETVLDEYSKMLDELVRPKLL